MGQGSLSLKAHSTFTLFESCVNGGEGSETNRRLGRRGVTLRFN